MRTRSRASARWAGVVRHFAALVDGGFNLADQRGKVGDALGDAGELRQLAGERRDLVARVSGCAQEDGDLENVVRWQDGGAGGGEQGLFNCGGLTHVEVWLESREGLRFGSGGEAAADLFGVGRRGEFEGEVAAAR